MAYGDSVEPFGLDYTGRATYLAWTKDVAARGGLAVRLPDQAGGSLVGVLGERYPASVIAAQGMGTPLVWTTGNQFGYYLAPRSVRVLDLLHRVHDDVVIQTGKAAETAENVAKGLLGASTIGVIAILAFMYLSTRRGR